jgi:hypothetical protein
VDVDVAGVSGRGCGGVAPDERWRLTPGLISSCLATGPYFFATLAGVSDNDGQAAIDAGDIQASRIAFVGQRR